MSERRILVMQCDNTLLYRAIADKGSVGPPWTDRSARLIRRDDFAGRDYPSFEAELSDGTRFGGEMSLAFAERRCVEWIRGQ